MTFGPKFNSTYSTGGQPLKPSPGHATTSTPASPLLFFQRDRQKGAPACLSSSKSGTAPVGRPCDPAVLLASAQERPPTPRFPERREEEPGISSSCFSTVHSLKTSPGPRLRPTVGESPAHTPLGSLWTRPALHRQRAPASPENEPARTCLCPLGPHLAFTEHVSGGCFHLLWCVTQVSAQGCTLLIA